MYLQSEAETLQLDGARVWEPWLLTARPGARPVTPPGCLPLEGAPPEPGARGRLCLGRGREAVRLVWPLPHALGDPERDGEC